MAENRSKNNVDSTLISSLCLKYFYIFIAAFSLHLFSTPTFGEEALLADAVEKKDHATVRKLLGSADLNGVQADGMTALHWAAHHDDLETAKLLVKAGANVKAENRYGLTPLSLACRNGHAEIAELLLGAGADPNTTLRGGETALMTAARTGKPACVQTLLSHRADLHARESSGQTAIMWAAAEGHAAVVEILLLAGADFRTPLDSGFTPLFFAIREGHAAVVQVLLSAGADVNGTMQPKKRSGRSVRPGTSPLILAIENGHFELAGALLDAGADANDTRSGFTPLHTITWVRKPNRGDGENDLPPPAGSGRIDSLQCVRLLAQHGANLNATHKAGKTGRGQLGKNGATPFFLAADTADVPLMRLLVELGANPLVPNSDDATPLMAAAGLGTQAPGEEAGTDEECLEAVLFTLEKGGDINTVDKNGETAMHGAAYKGAPKLVQLLADKGAKIEIWNRTNKYGWTPLLIAEGYRPGNFRPLADTLAALHQVMLAAGVTPPPATVKKVAPGAAEYQAEPN